MSSLLREGEASTINLVTDTFNVSLGAYERTGTTTSAPSTSTTRSCIP
jgi:hypothetical protein